MAKYGIISGVLVGLLAGCAMMPQGLQTIAHLDANRYMGTWYEVARLDHAFERNMDKISATYTLQENGSISVLNKGYSAQKNKWKEAQGTAYFREDKPDGKIKVSFFWPFYGGYNIVDIDEGYSSVLIIGPSVKYAWILSRTPELDANRYQQLIAKAESIGVPRESWIVVKH